MKINSCLLEFKLFFKKIAKISKSKISFFKIIPSKIIFWGTPSFINIFREKKIIPIKYKKINMIKIWGEEYNFFILVKCLLKFKFDFLHYSNEFIKKAKPKVIISFLDLYRTFYLLNKNKNQTKILIQPALRNNDTNIFNKFKINEVYLKNKIDFIFCFNKQIKKKYEKISYAKVFNTGSFLSNSIKIKNKKKIYDILYISTFRKLDDKHDNIINKKITLTDYINSEKKLIKNIFEFSLKYEKKLFILCTNKKFQKVEEEKFFIDILGKNNYWKFIERTSDHYSFSYKTIDKANIVAGIDSTLLYESFGRGNKTVFFDIRPFNQFLKKNRHFAWPLKLKKNGPFWTSGLDSKNVENLLKKVLLLKNIYWKKIYKKYRNNIMNYDQNNKTFKRVLLQILNKNQNELE